MPICSIETQPSASPDDWLGVSRISLEPLSVGDRDLEAGPSNPYAIAGWAEGRQSTRRDNVRPRICQGRRPETILRGLGWFPVNTLLAAKTRLLGISKRVNEYLPGMLLYGVRSVVAQADRNPSVHGRWMVELSIRTQRNVVVVALPN